MTSSKDSPQNEATGRRPMVPTWQEAYEAGLRQLAAGAPPAEWADVGSIAATGLDATGAINQAVVELDFALNSSGGDAHATLSIQTEKIPLLIALEDFDATTDALRSAREAAAQGVTGTDLVRLAAYEALTDMLLLEPDVGRRAEGLVQELRHVGLEPISRLLLSWLIPYLFSQGLRSEAEPAIRSLEVAAEADQHPWRREDARFFRLASIATRELPPSFEPDPEHPENWLARWRGLQLSLWCSLARSPDRAQQPELDQIVAYSGLLPEPFRAHAEVFKTLVNNRRGAGSETKEPPERLTLLNLPAVLAACEASALGGTADGAERYDWVIGTVSPLARTSLEWPNSTERLLGLLAIRAGDVTAARGHFSQAIQFGLENNCRVDRALAKLQLAELIAETDPQAIRSQWEPARQEASGEVEALGLPPLPHAHQIVQSVGLGGSHARTARGALTRTTWPSAASAVTSSQSARRPEGGGTHGRTLTGTEFEILGMLLSGIRVQEIARRRDRSVSTIRWHVRRIHTKTDTHSLSDLLMWGLAHASCCLRCDLP